MAKKEKPFNNPFKAVKLKQPEPAPAAKKAPPAEPPARKRDASLSEEEVWMMATDGAAPLVDRSATIRPVAPPIAHAAAPLDPDLAAYDELRALVDGELPFDLADTDEFIEGATRGLDPRVIRRLRKGDFSVQGHLDLHGYLREHARPALEQFLTAARLAGKRCVLIVHGRGLHSKDQVPVLKEAVKRWLSTGRLSHEVLAFCSARQPDGGTGAIYVLLRRP